MKMPFRLRGSWLHCSISNFIVLTKWEHNFKHMIIFWRKLPLWEKLLLWKLLYSLKPTHSHSGQQTTRIFWSHSTYLINEDSTDIKYDSISYQHKHLFNSNMSTPLLVEIRTLLALIYKSLWNDSKLKRQINQNK